MMIGKSTFNSIVLTFLLVFLISDTHAQSFKGGFSKEEFLEMLKISGMQVNRAYIDSTFPQPQHHTMIYRSAVMGLDNRWDLWNGANDAVISIRGTTNTTTSWLANFYAASVAAKGSLQLNNSFKFDYTLSDDPRAAVHIGWLIATGYLSADIMPKIDSLYKTGQKNFIITGHSQGGAISFLMTAYLNNLKKVGRLPGDIQFKTYCSAAPKPGNLYFAYSYENMTKGGWAYNVVNSADWVPEAPISIQKESDFNTVNPFVNASVIIKKQKFPMNLVLRSAHRSLSHPLKKAQRKHEKLLGKRATKLIKKSLPEFIAPEFMHTSNYVRTGATVTLYADESYYNKFPNDSSKIFMHHLFAPYFYLVNKLKDGDY